MKIHANSTSLKCNICDETFPSGSTLAEHKLQHCKIQQGNICFVCKMSLKTEEQYYSHAQEHGYQVGRANSLMGVGHMLVYMLACKSSSRGLILGCDGVEEKKIQVFWVNTCADLSVPVLPFICTACSKIVSHVKDPMSTFP